MSILGPEFQRHVWLRFSWFSVLIMPILIGTTALLCFMTWQVNAEAFFARMMADSNLPLYNIIPHWSTLLAEVGRPMIFIVLFVLGSYEAASSFTVELRNRTWDMHKISAIRPIHLMIGKLFGVTSYSWFFSAGICFTALYGYAHTYRDLTPPSPDFMIGPVQAIFVYPNYEDMFYLSFSVIVSALIGHLIAALVSLQYLRRGRTGTFLALVLGVGASLVFLRVLTATFDVMHYEGSDLFRSVEAITWYGRDIRRNDFVFFLILYVTFWGVVGLYRSIRAELNFPTYPIYLNIFLMTFCLLISGFSVVFDKTGLGIVNNLSDNFTVFFPSFFILFVATYAVLYNSSEDVGKYLRFYRALRCLKFLRALQFLPGWVFPFMLCVGLLGLWHYHAASEISVGVTAFTLSALLLMVRDGLVLHIFLLGNRYKRAGLIIASYYIFCYILIPFLVFYALVWLSPVEVNASVLWSEDHYYRYIFGLFYPYGHSRLDSAIFPLCIVNVILMFILWHLTGIYRNVSVSQSDKRP